MAAEEKELPGRGAHPNSRAALEANRFQPGHSGNPAGRPKQIATRLMREMASAPVGGGAEGETRLRRIVDRLLVKAESGDLDAIKIVFDRLEGRPRQSVTLDLNERERYEQMVEQFIDGETAEGRECTREQAIAALSLFKPELADILA
jgi:Family of unknown function (DUF5681)